MSKVIKLKISKKKKKQSRVTKVAIESLPSDSMGMKIDLKSQCFTLVAQSINKLQSEDSIVVQIHQE